MSVLNSWLTPFQRSYNQIKSKLIEKLKLQVPELTDYSEGNIFILIISLFAAIAEVLHYYIDNMARETFFISSRRFSSVIKHSKLVDYHMHAGIPYSVDVIISNSDNTPVGSNISIPVNTKFKDSNGNEWISTKTVVWYSGTYGVTVPLEQKTRVDSVSFGNIPGDTNFVIYLGDLPTDSYYVEGSMNLVIGSDNWTLVDTFAYSSPTDKHYKVELDEELKPYIQFGDGIHGAIPEANLPVVGSYYITKGASGKINSNSITSLPSSLNFDNKVICNNYNDASGGSNYETFDEMKVRVPLSIRTLGVAITKQDYEDILKMVPGVGKSYVNYICGKYLEIYISPEDGGVASQSLLDKAYNYLLNRKVLTTSIKMLPVNTADVYLTASITGRKSFNSTDISNQVIQALIDEYGYENSQIGKPIRISDLYALMDNQSMVDYLSIDKIFTKPYPKKIGQTITELNITYFNVVNINLETTYLFIYNNNNTFYLQDTIGNNIGGIQIGVQTTVEDSINNNKFVITIGAALAGNYSFNNTWSFKLVPSNRDQLVGDILLPVLKSENITLNISETV